MGVSIEAVRVLAVVWVYIYCEELGKRYQPCPVMGDWHERLLPSTRGLLQSAPVVLQNSKLSTSVGRVLVCEELRECEGLPPRSTSDGNSCDAHSSVDCTPVPTQEDYCPSRDSNSGQTLQSN